MLLIPMKHVSGTGISELPSLVNTEQKKSFRQWVDAIETGVGADGPARLGGQNG